MDISRLVRAAAEASVPLEHSPEPFYNKHGDCIQCMLAPVATWAERVGDVITIYRSMEDDSPVGYQIKGVKALLAAHRADRLHLDDAVKGGELVGVRVTVLQLIDLAIERLFAELPAGEDRPERILPLWELAKRSPKSELCLS